MQNNAKIIKALNEWETGIHGYFWNRDPKEAEFNWLASYIVQNNKPYVDRFGDTFCNFSLTDPNAKKLISTFDEFNKWILENRSKLVKIENVSLSEAKNYLNIVTGDINKYLVQTSLTEWTPITGIEVV
jgi:hypothetical protein